MIKRTKRECAEWLSALVGVDAKIIEGLLIENKINKRNNYSIDCFELEQIKEDIKKDGES